MIDIYSDVLGSCRHFDETKNGTKIFMERLGRASVLLSIYFEWLTTSGAILFWVAHNLVSNLHSLFWEISKPTKEIMATATRATSPFINSSRRLPRRENSLELYGKARQRGGVVGNVSQQNLRNAKRKVRAATHTIIATNKLHHNIGSGHQME